MKHLFADMDQQATEKIMKGLLLAHNEIAWGHSVLTLLKRFAEAVDIEIQEIEGCAKELDRHYITSRYPDAYPSGDPSDYYTEKIAKDALSCAQKVKDFAERMISVLKVKLELQE